MLRWTALLLTILTGFSGLVYEITWEKYLATLLGSHSEATAAILALFLGGLSVGYWLFGEVTRRMIGGAGQRNRPARLLQLYGCLEAGIGVYALLFPTLFVAVQALSIFVPLGSGLPAFAFDVLLSALLILPPAILMGGTIPILTQALATGLDDATRFHALVYGFNTVGAFGGALAAGFWLIPALGLVGTLVAMSLVNLAAGVVFVVIGARPLAAAAMPAGPDTSRVAGVPGYRAFVAVALLCGFAMMTVQTTVIRIAGLSFGASQFTFSMVVAVFVLSIAIGSLAVSTARRIPRLFLVFDLWALFATLLLVYGQLDDAPYWAHRIRGLFSTDPADFYPYHITAFAGVLLYLIVPVSLSGATLPLIFHHMRSQTGSLGNVAGSLYSWNTLGSVLGALVGGYALFFWLDLHQVYRVALLAVAAAATLATLQVWGLGLGRVLALGLAAWMAVAILPEWPVQRLAIGLFRQRAVEPSEANGPDDYFANEVPYQYIFHDDGPAATVTVRELLRMGESDLSIWTNGKSDGSTRSDYRTMALAGLVPALLADRIERCFVIGFGTGITAGELASFSPEVIVAEISRSVMKAAPLFDHANQYVTENPRARIVESDAYRALLRSRGSFDVIASEPSNPWVTGVEMLFSREFLSVARDKLAPGGVYAQWFHSYETDSETVAMVLRTYASVFDHVSVWFTQDSDLLLLGFQSDEHALDLDRIARRFARPDFAAGFRRAGIKLLPTLLSHELLPLGAVHAMPLAGPVHTLLHPRLSDLAARSFFAGGTGQLPRASALEIARVAQGNSLFQRYLARSQGQLSSQARARIVRNACRFRPVECVTLLAQWAHQDPDDELRLRVQKQVLGRILALLPGREDEVVFEQIVERTAELFQKEATPVPGMGGQFALARAQAASELFDAHYFHVAPFPREALARYWRQCEAIPSVREACRKGRLSVERRLGVLAQ